MKSLIIVFSYHHGNTEKVAIAIAGALGAEVKTPDQVDPAKLLEYDLVGFGSGIDSSRHYKPILDLADSLPQARGRKAFIFSTCGIPAAAFGENYIENYADESHAALRGKLMSKGYVIVGEFNCPGHNTNGFLRYFGGFNKGRPNAGDLENAEEFARGMMRRPAGSGIGEC
jgi:flavodoxin